MYHQQIGDTIHSDKEISYLANRNWKKGGEKTLYSKYANQKESKRKQVLWIWWDFLVAQVQNVPSKLNYDFDIFTQFFL